MTYNPFALSLSMSPLSPSFQKKSQKTLQVFGILLATAPKIMPHLWWENKCVSVCVYKFEFLWVCVCYYFMSLFGIYLTSYKMWLAGWLTNQLTDWLVFSSATILKIKSEKKRKFKIKCWTYHARHQSKQSISNSSRELIIKAALKIFNAET